MPGPPGASRSVPSRLTGAPETDIWTRPVRLPSAPAAPQVCVSTTLSVSPTMFRAKSGRSSAGSTRSVRMTVSVPLVDTLALCEIAAVAAHFASWKAWSARTAKTSSGVAAYSIVVAIFMRGSLVVSSVVARRWSGSSA